MPATSQPFGDNEVTTGGCAVASPDFLTGKPRDAESGLDDFGARYLSSQWGRWMSADWTAGASAVPYATLTNPQSLNLYAYVGNDPVDGMDADGHARYDHGCGAYLSMCALLAADGDGVSSSSSSGDEAYLDSTLEQNTEHASDDEHDSETPASHIPKPFIDKKHGFWSRLGQHLGNLMHGDSWNHGMRESGEGFVVPADPNQAITFGTDAAGLFATATKNTPLGYVIAGVSVANDHSAQNVITNGLGPVPGFGWPMAIIGAFNDFLDWGAHNSDPTGPTWKVNPNGEGFGVPHTSTGGSNDGGTGEGGGGTYDFGECQRQGFC